jgi:hypothetical protein
MIPDPLMMSDDESMDAGPEIDNSDLNISVRAKTDSDLLYFVNDEHITCWLTAAYSLYQPL